MGACPSLLSAAEGLQTCHNTAAIKAPHMCKEALRWILLAASVISLHAACSSAEHEQQSARAAG